VPLNSDFPQRLFRFPKEANKKWELVNDLYAWLDLDRVEPLPDEVARIDPKTAICKVKENIEQVFQDGNQVAPVYRFGANGTLCVPTGLIFIILNEGCSIEECSEQISAAEFLIEKQSPAGGAWLRHQPGSIQSTLSCFGKLVEIEAVQSAEPQFLMQRGEKN